MTKKNKGLNFCLLWISSLVFMAGVIVALHFAPSATALQLYNPQFNYSYFDSNTATTSACEVLYGASGTIHALTVGTPGASGVVTLYDSNIGSVSPLTAATATIYVGPTSSATSTATGTIQFVLNNQTITTASVGNGSTTSQAATAIATAITASSTALGVTATTSSNIVTITASVIGPVGNIAIPTIAGQNGLVFYTLFTNATGTSIISQTTFAPTTTYQSYPETASYDSVFKNGLCIQETTATSSVTVSWQQQ